jgi:hypothetical protein
MTEKYLIQLGFTVRSTIPSRNLLVPLFQSLALQNLPETIVLHATIAKL